ncbi:MAG: peroxiredoxin [Sphingomonas taxi]|uniref:Peroxiredoxin n=1 Tax=Sphingomonas taxi TaxID=1549858 RepID=A0A2W5PB87_9SPHN|nr:MAG: peroxiredoxin [Sphingomonas taxi]
MSAPHHFRIALRWTGDRGTGTSSYAAYGRDHVIEGEGKAAAIPGSSDPRFRGDAARWNPEELLLAALSACHQLWYLHLCADAGITVTDYRDAADAELVLEPDGGGRIVAATLRPAVTIAAGGDAARASSLHGEARRLCFIARSVAFPVRHEACVTTAPVCIG